MECVLFVIGFFVIAAMASESKKSKAKQEYDAALHALRRDPVDSRLRERALAKGRYYSNLTRNSKGVTIYDEMAIKNDLDAAAAAAPATMPSATPTVQSMASSSPTMSAPSVEDRLRKLDNLMTGGHITEEEHTKRRQAILDELQRKLRMRLHAFGLGVAQASRLVPQST